MCILIQICKTQKVLETMVLTVNREQYIPGIIKAHNTKNIYEH